MEAAHSLVSNEIEMEMVPEKYMDVITYEFAYDPVRLPLDQDPTQNLYNRKTLETIWETNFQAQNPFTKQWFNAKSVIPQRELRQEMEDYIKLQKFSGCRGEEVDVIEEYTKILEEGEMKQYLEILGKALSEKVTTQKQCSTMWKRINLLRLYCQFHCKNIETFQYLHGFRYLNDLIIQIAMLLNSKIIGKDTKETAWDVCKEISRAIDVIGLKPLDIHEVESSPNRKSTQDDLFRGYIKMVDPIYLYEESYKKVESLMLRMFCRILNEMNAQAEQILGEDLYRSLDVCYDITAMKFSQDAKDISSEDLYHGIAILQSLWITTSSLYYQSQTLAFAIILCIAREIDRSEEITGLSEGQLVEAEAEGWHNSEALEMGLRLIKDILRSEEVSRVDLLQEGCLELGLDIVKEIVRMFEHFTQPEKEDETGDPVFCAKNGCKIFDCFHSRIAQLGLDISTGISTYMNIELPDTEVLLKFIKSESTISG